MLLFCVLQPVPPAHNQKFEFYIFQLTLLFTQALREYLFWGWDLGWGWDWDKVELRLSLIWCLVEAELSFFLLRVKMGFFLGQCKIQKLFWGLLM